MTGEDRDIKTFDELYNGYSADIYKFTYSLTGNPEEANDITQETFIKLYSQLTSAQNPDNPKAWIYRVAANTCYNHLKRKKKFRQIIEENPAVVPTQSPATMENDLIEAQEIMILRNALNQLPVRDRIILSLYKEGFSPTDLAQLIKVKKNSIGKILARSIEKLAKKINQGVSQ